MKRKMIVSGEGDYSISRKRMVAEQLMARGIRDEAILRAMLKIPRHFFVDQGMATMAYSDHPLSIGQYQTISQPYIVAYMLEALEITKNHRVLEVGTGSGYQTALLADLVGHVYSIERLPGLILKARKVLRQLSYKNITLKLGDGTEGWPQQAPFHAIVVSAASPSVPHPYLDQLVEGGRMVVPVGDEHSQELTLISKNKGRISKRILSGCRFVKLKGKYGFQAS